MKTEYLPLEIDPTSIDETGARDQEQDAFDIIAVGPMSDGFLIDVDGQEYVISTLAEAYPVTEFERVAPLFTGLPVYYKHGGSGELVKTRFLVGDKGRVGRLERAWYEPSTREIHAVLRVTSAYWRAELRQRIDRWEYGFSMSIAVEYTTPKAMDIINKITRLYSVDLVDFAACGGRFLDAPAMTEKEIAEAAAYLEMILEEKTNAK